MIAYVRHLFDSSRRLDGLDLGKGVPLGKLCIAPVPEVLVVFNVAEDVVLLAVLGAPCVGEPNVETSLIQLYRQRHSSTLEP